MANAEAIETLRANYPDACYEQLREAVDAAIEALKAQDAAGDAISRQAAIDALDCINGVEEVLRSLPPAQPEQGWIPVSERLPEEGKDVLLTYKNNMVVGNWGNICGEVTWYANSGDGWFTAMESVDNDGIPIAWMPLPEPYQSDAERRTE